MATTNIYASGHSSVANAIIDSPNAYITYPNSLVTTDVSVNEIISDFFHHRAGVVSCPWYEGNGPCSVQIRLALPYMFDVSGMSDVSFNEIRKTQLDGFVGAFGNINLGTEVVMSQTIHRSEISGNSTYNYLCVYPSVACAAYYWLAAGGGLTSPGGFETSSIFGSLIGLNSEFSTAYTNSGEILTFNSSDYYLDSVKQNYFCFTGLDASQVEFFKTKIYLNEDRGFWTGSSSNADNYGKATYDPSNGPLFRFPVAAGMTTDGKGVEGFFRPEISISGSIENAVGYPDTIDYASVYPYSDYSTSVAYPSKLQLDSRNFSNYFPNATYLPPTAAEFADLSGNL